MRWHEMVKEALKETGKERGYDVSESEKEMVLAEKFREFHFELVGAVSDVKDYGKARREPHTFSYKPDGVWKKGLIYRAIFEVEHLRARNSSSIKAKRKYSVGSFMLSYLAMIKKSARHTVFITDNRILYHEIVTFKQLILLGYRKRTHTLFLKADNPYNIKVALEKPLINKWKT